MDNAYRAKPHTYRIPIALIADKGMSWSHFAYAATGTFRIIDRSPCHSFVSFLVASLIAFDFSPFVPICSQCISSNGCGQVRPEIKREFRLFYTFFPLFTQGLKHNFVFFAAA
jgi:hypothetical protein